jgi:hypothetical protein
MANSAPYKALGFRSSSAIREARAMRFAMVVAGEAVFLFESLSLLVLEFADTLNDRLNKSQQTIAADFGTVVAGFVACFDVGLLLGGDIAKHDDLAESFPSLVSEGWHWSLML